MGDCLLVLVVFFLFQVHLIIGIRVRVWLILGREQSSGAEPLPLLVNQLVVELPTQPPRLPWAVRMVARALDGQINHGDAVAIALADSDSQPGKGPKLDLADGAMRVGRTGDHPLVHAEHDHLALAGTERTKAAVRRNHATRSV